MDWFALHRYRIYDDDVTVNESPAPHRSNHVNGELTPLPPVTVTMATSTATEAADTTTTIHASR